MDAGIARRLYRLFEPYHALVYFAPEAREAYAEAGLKGGWMGYFATRAAAMGPVPAAVVVATFYHFSPALVERAIPAAWQLSSPEKALVARRQIADRALERLLGDLAGSEIVEEAAGLAREAIDGCAVAGRPLYAAQTSLPWPDDPHLALWHAANLIREHRGDAHNAILTAEDLGGCEANVLNAGRALGPEQRAIRGWTEEEWSAAAGRLQERGLLDAGNSPTAAGRRLRDSVEQRTDERALPPWERLGEAGAQRLLELMRPIATRVVEGGGMAYPNPVGLPRFE